VKATVLMRRKANSQNSNSKITDMPSRRRRAAGIATVDRRGQTMPIKGRGQVRDIAGPAMAKTARS